MKVLDLFSGIGGFSLGLERAGMRTVAFCEIEPYCHAVLKKHWPSVPCYDDVRMLTAQRLKKGYPMEMGALERVARAIDPLAFDEKHFGSMSNANTRSGDFELGQEYAKKRAFEALAVLVTHAYDAEIGMIGVEVFNNSGQKTLPLKMNDALRAMVGRLLAGD